MSRAKVTHIGRSWTAACLRVLFHGTLGLVTTSILPDGGAGALRRRWGRRLVVDGFGRRTRAELSRQGPAGPRRRALAVVESVHDGDGLEGGAVVGARGLLALGPELLAAGDVDQVRVRLVDRDVSLRRRCGGGEGAEEDGHG